MIDSVELDLKKKKKKNVLGRTGTESVDEKRKKEKEKKEVGRGKKRGFLILGRMKSRVFGWWCLGSFNYRQGWEIGALYPGMHGLFYCLFYYYYYYYYYYAVCGERERMAIIEIEFYYVSHLLDLHCWPGRLASWPGPGTVAGTNPIRRDLPQWMVSQGTFQHRPLGRSRTRAGNCQAASLHLGFSCV